MNFIVAFCAFFSKQRFFETELRANFQVEDLFLRSSF